MARGGGGGEGGEGGGYPPAEAQSPSSRPPDLVPAPFSGQFYWNFFLFWAVFHEFLSSISPAPLLKPNLPPPPGAKIYVPAPAGPISTPSCATHRVQVCPHPPPNHLGGKKNRPQLRGENFETTL